MSIDLRAALRRRKPERRKAPLLQRPDAELLPWDSIAGRGPVALLLDTTVYVDRAAGRLPAELREFIDGALLFHSPVALGELAVGVAHADPTHPTWQRMRDHYTALFAAIPASRVVTPDAQTWVDAGLVSAVLPASRVRRPRSAGPASTTR